MGGQHGTGRARRRGIGRVEVIALLVVLAVIAAIVIPAIGRARRSEANRLRAGCVRVQMQVLLEWAENHSGQFPLPSALDLTDATVAAKGAAKNTSANIISLLLWSQSTVPGMQVDENETGNIEIDEDYEYHAPRAAVRPAEALWDPAFNADFTGAVPGNLSWAHQIPSPSESGAWGNRLSSWMPVVSRRGAKMNGIGGTEKEPIPIWADPGSRNLRRSGGRLDWEGAVAYGDGHVTHETGAIVSGPRLNPASLPDAFFFDEPGPEHAGNDYLSIFTTAGERRSDFTAIWD